MRRGTFLRLQHATTPTLSVDWGQEDVAELVGAAWEHLQGGGQQPHAFGHCLNCHRLIIGWSAYQWSIMVREPCPKCGKPW